MHLKTVSKIINLNEEEKFSKKLKQSNSIFVKTSKRQKMWTWPFFYMKTMQ